MGSQYWSNVSTLIAHVENPVTISSGGGAFTLTVLKGQNNPLANVNCYLFTDTGAYLGAHEVTSGDGNATFDLANGNYKIRIDHLGYQFWTDVFSVPHSLSMTHTIPHQDVNMTVQGNYSGDIDPRENVGVYLFTPSGSYLGQSQQTDALGRVSFNLPEMDYKVRADYLGNQYWSDAFTWANQTVTINEGVAEVHVTTGSAPIEHVPVYVFTNLESYLGINAQSDQNGVVSFRLPEGTYKFRADHMGSQYWATETVTAHQINEVTVDTGGGAFTLTVQKQAGNPIAGIPVYVFQSTGSYLGISAQTDAQGHVSFELPDGAYQFRADYMGYQFWSSVSTAPATLSDVLTIAHQDVTVKVEGLYQAPTSPIGGVPVYLFNATGSYLGISGTSDANGNVTFSLPQQSYMVRADYLGNQFWSAPFIWGTPSVTINQGMAVLHVIKENADVVDAPVYLFTASGSYLGSYERTDASGLAEFLLPDKQYKFRVDYSGAQYWSNLVTIIPYEENHIELDLDLLAQDLTNDPTYARFDGKPPDLVPENTVQVLLSSVLDVFTLQDAFAQTGEDRIYFFINDHLGTPLKVMDENGVVVWSADYIPFGEMNVTTETLKNNFRAPGQIFDAETGLHVNWHRYYSPQIGRYITPDPIGQAGGVNLYPYVLNNPVNLIDPWGLETIYYGYASYYNLPGQKTASGAMFDPTAFTSAMTSEKAPFGTDVTVEYTPNEGSGTNSICVEVNDRGPFQRGPDRKPLRPLRPDPENIIDLTPAAFKELVGSLGPGKVPVTVRVP